ncbi:CBO0543 family protein [Cohnella sp. OV330]|uniref:CBO0543 family protein n=1 Tax=Cohnella sp. OV330 TaxID=1855288 RepID=UPI00350E9A3E
MIGLFFIKKASRVMLLSFPISAYLGLLFNDIGVAMKWWSLVPSKLESIATLPYSLGLYPVVVSLMYQFVYPKLKATGFIILTAILLTLCELCFMLLGHVDYEDGWNTGWTLVSYMIACCIVFVNMKLLKKVFNVP